MHARIQQFIKIPNRFMRRRRIISILLPGDEL